MTIVQLHINFVFKYFFEMIIFYELFHTFMGTPCEFYCITYLKRIYTISGRVVEDSEMKKEKLLGKYVIIT